MPLFGQYINGAFRRSVSSFPYVEAAITGLALAALTVKAFNY
jgi:hypothetical protein